MPVKIRLQRHGRKGVPFYHIVVADARAPRDGKYIEKLGVYNPITVPATIDLDVDKTVTWLKNGAQPTDTTRAILSYKGVLYKKHLDLGVTKGALSSELAEEKFNSWKAQKEGKIIDHKTTVENSKSEESKKRFAQEQKVKEERAEANNAKKLAALELANPSAVAESPADHGSEGTQQDASA
jgi:small subunit ribosomal protein S16